ncbi:copper-binding protein [Amphritea balenae]|uniref:Copper-binding protein n=1 Tax=Amphritea balenae TaxID=452629 RepID=A0A3P1SSD0_9GAMM|nr:copper-binding protein [Amphritea balenae]RRC99939.1 hypothetical protein EHS89_06895 [Amphritea balenae]GGK75260.1 hypothetical protein GCM10007941_26700 [Amphritea balenae]
MKSFDKNSVLTAVTTAALLVGAIASATLISTTVAAGDMKSEHKHHNMQANADMKPMAEVVMVDGVVKRVIADSNQLIVHHQPIAAWTMAEMQMKFNLADGLSVADFNEGQKIHFKLKQENMMKFTIIEVLK